MTMWDEVIARLERIEKKIDELSRRPTPVAGMNVGAPAPGPRRRSDGTWERWSEGTGWSPCDPPRVKR